MKKSEIKRYLFVIFLLFSNLHLYSQDNPLFTQQWFSRINHNPASVGSNECFDVFIAHRNQWTGFSKSPKTMLLNAHTTINDFNSGLGISILYDKEGPARTNSIGKILYSYRFRTGEYSQLSMGLGLGLQNRSIDFTKLETFTPGDPDMGTTKETKLSAGADFGIEFLTDKIVFGASVTNIGRQYKKLTTFNNGTQYYLYEHCNLNIDRDLTFSPTFTYVCGNKKDLVEIGSTIFYKDAVWAGIVYRINNAVCLMGGFKYGIFRIGYSYDYHTNNAKQFGQTHEIVLSIRIPKPQKPLVRNRDGSYTARKGRIYQCR